MQLELFTTVQEAWKKYIKRVKIANECYSVLVDTGWLESILSRPVKITVAEQAYEIIQRDHKEREAFDDLQKELKDAI